MPASKLAEVVAVLMKLRGLTILFLVVAALLLVVAFTVGFQRLREATGGPMGPVLVGLSSLLMLASLVSWWGPVLLR